MKQYTLLTLVLISLTSYAQNNIKVKCRAGLVRTVIEKTENQNYRYKVDYNKNSPCITICCLDGKTWDCYFDSQHNIRELYSANYPKNDELFAFGNIKKSEYAYYAEKTYKLIYNRDNDNLVGELYYDSSEGFIKILMAIREKLIENEMRKSISLFNEDSESYSFPLLILLYRDHFKDKSNSFAEAYKIIELLR
jgi:hypothetical protein